MAEGEDEELLSSKLCSSSSTVTEEEKLNLNKRILHTDIVLRFLSILCLSLMVGLFTLQLNIAWRSREMLRDLGLDDEEFLYPDFFRDAHNDETWCWDPDTLMLKVNTSLYVH